MSSGHYQQQDRGSSDAYASYFAGMDASMQQKVALTTAHFPTRGRIADMGSGSGRGTFDLACLHPDLALVGVDINPAAVASAQARFQRPNLEYVTGDIADPVFPPDSLDGILDSSVLHHVTSFTGFSTRRLEACLDSQVRALRTDGVLIIRDFVAPDGPGMVDLDLREDDGSESGAIPGLSTWALWRRYAQTVRNSRHQPGTLPWEDLGSRDGGWHRLRCQHRDAQEFLLRKDYRQDWDVELLEEYTYWTQVELISAMERRGLRMVTATPIRNPWIVANRYHGRIRLWTLDGEPLPPPPTNLVVVGQKVQTCAGTRLTLDTASAITTPSFLTLQSWKGDNGSQYDLAERPGRTIDVLPWHMNDQQVLVLAKQGFPRPVVVADPARPNLTGANWSGYLTEPIAAIVDPEEPAEQAVVRILSQRAGLGQDAIRAWSAPFRYATSPGGIDEVVTAILVETAPTAESAPQHYGGLAESGTVRELDARACLRAAQVGGLFDARLELNIHHLLRQLHTPPGPWIGATFDLPDVDVDWPLDDNVLQPSERIAFHPVAGTTEFLDIRHGRFVETAADGRPLATVEREWVQPKTASGNSAVVLPLIRLHGTVLVGLEHRWLPAMQKAFSKAGFAAAPAWRLPRSVDRLDRAEDWLRARLPQVHGCHIANLTELGGPYLATPGATPELVHPWVAEVDPSHGPGNLHWLPLVACLDDARVVDAHLLIAAFRAAHALGLLGGS